MNITYSALLAAVAPTFVVLACGFALRRFHGLRPEADGSMLTVAVNFLYPCFIADTVLNSTALRDVRTVAVAPVVAFSMLLACFALAALAAKILRLKNQQSARTFAFAAAIPIQSSEMNPLPSLSGRPGGVIVSPAFSFAARSRFRARRKASGSAGLGMA